MAAMSKEKEIWQRITSHFASILPAEDFSTWFCKLRPLTLDPDLAVIRVPNKFFADWAEEHYLPDIQDVLEQALRGRPRIRFECEPGGHRVDQVPHPGPAASVASHVDPEMTFERFFCTYSNLFAYSCCREIVEKPACNYSPLYLFSSQPAGKTHLLQAVGNLSLQRLQGPRIGYVHADGFTFAFSQAARYRRVHEFREDFLDLDLLLVDDVHFLAGRSRTQEELTVILHALLRKGRTLVVSSGDVPFRLPDAPARLKSILGWGLLAQLHPPEPELRAKVLSRKAAEEGLGLPEDVICYLAESTADLKDLMRRLARVQSLVSLRNGPPVTLPAVKSVIGGRGLSPPRVTGIKAVTASYFNVSVDDLVSGKRQRAYSYPRQIAMYLCRKHTGMSYKKIGEAFANKDHSTVLHAVRRIEKDRDRNEQLDLDLKNLENLLA